jgi:hypothetical protein
MVTLLNEPESDPSYYLVFQQALKKWLERSDPLRLIDFTTIVSAAVGNLADSTVPSTGTSLSLLWTVTRPIVPSTFEEWDTFNKILSFMDDFDDKVAAQYGNTLWFQCSWCEVHLDEILGIKSVLLESISMLGRINHQQKLPEV